MVSESNEILGFSLGVQIDEDFPRLLVFLRLIHDSCGKVHIVTEDRKLLARPTGANDSREYLTGGNSNVTIGIINFEKLTPHVHSCEYGPSRIVLMSKGAQTPNTNQSTALIIHDKLVDRPFEAVDLLLHSGDDPLDLIHSLLGLGT
jgi:hypothetical protein